MFLPVKFVHPVRTSRWRAGDAADGLRLDVLRGLGGMGRLRPPSWAHWGLMVTSLYLVLAGAVQQILFGAEA